jgi:cytochrome c oxidase assembly factor CtaG/polyferredoxin
VDPTCAAFLRSWPLDPWVVFPLLLTAWIYVRGWRQLRRRGSPRFGPRELWCFLGGLAALFLALASPIEPFSTLLLQVHMLQHLLLMMVAPPLLWLGAPLIPLLRGLPVDVRRHWVGPFLRAEVVRAAFGWLVQPPVAWVLFVVTTWLWHTPQLYEIALRSDGWHYLQHTCFLGTALLFWWPVVRPYPARPQWSRWVLLPYLFLADVQNTALAALLTFSSRLLYPHYAAVPHLWGMTAREDQAVAGVIMWVPGSLAFLVPLVWIGFRLLYGRTREPVTNQQHPTPTGRIALPLVTAKPSAEARWDLLRLPLIGRFLKWRHARLTLQIPLFLLAALVIWDGLRGPQLSPMNLAGVLPWIHWRGLVVLGLLIAGNVFCMACPFLLPRTLARKWFPVGRAWPRWLRSKWLAVGLLVLFFWAYETFALWASPWWTAWIALAYFVAAFVIDSTFRGAAFCKYLCPIGQFHFVQSLVSPLEVGVRNLAVCRECSTKDCIRGRPPHPTLSPRGGEGRVRGGIPGCELHLFQPRKAGNLDCTFCLDCIHACPHDNIGIVTAIPGAALWHDRQRSGLGRFGRRPDLAALVLVLVFGAFANAAGMVGPVLTFQDWVAAALGQQSSTLVVTASLIAALVVLPLLLVGTATVLGRWWSGDRGRWLDLATRFSFALVPLGCGMWLAHYSFHFFSSADTIIPVSQRFVADLGRPWLGLPQWGYSCCVAVAPWLLRLEVVFLDLGLLLSLYTAYRIAQDRFPDWSRAIRACLPWATLLLLLFVAGIWLVFQPMEMRGALAMAR